MNSRPSKELARRDENQPIWGDKRSQSTTIRLLKKVYRGSSRRRIYFGRSKVFSPQQGSRSGLCILINTRSDSEEEVES